MNFNTGETLRLPISSNEMLYTLPTRFGDEIAWQQLKHGHSLATIESAFFAQRRALFFNTGWKLIKIRMRINCLFLNFKNLQNN